MKVGDHSDVFDKVLILHHCVDNSNDVKHALRSNNIDVAFQLEEEFLHGKLVSERFFVVYQVSLRADGSGAGEEEWNFH